MTMARIMVIHKAYCHYLDAYIIIYTYACIVGFRCSILGCKSYIYITISYSYVYIYIHSMGKLPSIAHSLVTSWNIMVIEWIIIVGYNGDKTNHTGDIEWIWDLWLRDYLSSVFIWYLM